RRRCGEIHIDDKGDCPGQQKRVPHQQVLRAMPEIEPDCKQPDKRQVSVQVETVQEVHEPAVMNYRLLKFSFPEDAKAFLEGHNVSAALNRLADTLVHLAADEIVERQGHGKQQYLGAVLQAGSPLEDWIEGVSHLCHACVEMSAE